MLFSKPVFYRLVRLVPFPIDALLTLMLHVVREDQQLPELPLDWNIMVVLRPDLFPNYIKTFATKYQLLVWELSELLPYLIAIAIEFFMQWLMPWSWGQLNALNSCWLFTRNLKQMTCSTAKDCSEVWWRHLVVAVPFRLLCFSMGSGSRLKMHKPLLYKDIALLL